MIDLSRHKNKRYPKKYIHQNHSLQCDKTQQNYTIYIYTGRLTSAIPNLPPLHRFSIDRGHYQHRLPNVSKRNAAWDKRDLIQSYSIPSPIHPSSIHDPQCSNNFTWRRRNYPGRAAPNFQPMDFRLTWPNLHPRFRIQ